jgi:exodeoxyribonuclease V beta subunit
LILKRDVGASLERWYLESAGKPIGKSEAGAAAANATAAEIARLLALASRDEARIVESSGLERELRGGDIAVLVRNHRQAKKVRDALSALGVASVQRGAENVFSSREAEELERVLLAVAEPGRESLIAAALTTEMMGYTGESLHAARADEALWEQDIERFREAHREWHERGFIRMLRGLFQTYDCVRRLLEYADGERRVTNLLHLAELVHCEAGDLGTAGLVAWLATKRRECNPAIEAELLRLESDDNLVKILTIHVAKGLEFPLVFCPYLWDVKLWADDEDLVRFHDPARGHRPFLEVDPESSAPSREQARREEVAENLRLLYVALTRAKHRCWIVWGHIKDAERSAPAWLLHGPGDRQTAEALAAFSSGTVALAPAKMSADLQRLSERSNGGIRVSPIPIDLDAGFDAHAPAERVLAARKFDTVLRDTRRVASFTALAHGRSIEAPDYDAGDKDPLPESVSGRDLFAFPRGAQAGKCIHTIFENVDFARLERPGVEHVVNKALASHGFEPVWVRALVGMVEAVVDTPLDASGMCLRSVPRERRLDELEFYYPLGAVSDTGLRNVLRGGGFPEEIRERIGALTFNPTQGYMTGFIDLVFEHGGRYYLADYKSNWLGATVSAYRQSDLARAMGREAYYLQYLIYCVALHRYLGARVPGYRYAAHFGGVRYLFVRGMGPTSGAECGVFGGTPSQSLIVALDEYLREGSP